VLILVTILHTRYHLPFRGCALALLCMSLIFTALRLVPPENPMPRTLQTVFKCLDLHDQFLIHPLCKSCHRIYSPNSLTNAICLECSTKLYKPSPTTLFALLRGKEPPPPTPKRAMPIQTLLSALPDFLSRSNNERLCQAWRTWRSTPGEKQEIWDGNVWKTICGLDQRCWFDPADNPEELRIGVTMSINWLLSNLLSALTILTYFLSGLGESRAFSDPCKHQGYCHILCPILPACFSNLHLFNVVYMLTLIRYCPSNLIIAAMTPGPKEPNAEELQHILKIIVDKLLELYEHGIRVSTPEYPNGNFPLLFDYVLTDHCKVTSSKSFFLESSAIIQPCAK